MHEKLPSFLLKARDQAANKYLHADYNYLTAKWKIFVNEACSEIPELTYNERSKLLSLGDISPGCHICRSGKWDCFFVTHKCNLNCDFCYSINRHPQNFQGSNLGNDIRENIKRYHQVGIQGVSFSGGEALLEIEKLYHWLEFCNHDHHLEHIWLYTNGLLLNEAILQRLSELGLNEIRFNAAATSYQHPHVIKMLQKSTQYFEWVTVEIPLIAADEDSLFSSLPIWADKGVRVLNIHEFLYEPGSNAENFPGHKQQITLPDGHQTAINPDSDALALKVFQKVKQHNLSLGVNYCSTVGKWQQLTARRELILPERKEPDEKYLGNGVLESFYSVRNNHVKSIAPEELEEIRSSSKDLTIYHLKRMAPLSLKETRKDWLSFEVLS
ncbi:MAG: radical SAM protein [Chloroflexota bacterium]|nr:radical SAM protein [Chloroflexota bacterium]